MLKKLWDWSGWIVGAYAIYSHVKTLDRLRGDVYESLSPEQRAKLESVIGAIKKEIPGGIFNQPLIVAVPAPATAIEQIHAGV